MFIVTRIWISISDLDLNSIIESHNENLKNLLNFIIIIKMANGMGSFAFFGFISRPWHFWAHINYHCDPFDTRTPNFYFLGWFSDLFFWPKKRCAFWLKFLQSRGGSDFRHRRQILGQDTYLMGDCERSERLEPAAGGKFFWKWCFQRENLLEKMKSHVNIDKTSWCVIWWKVIMMMNVDFSSTNKVFFTKK